MKLGLPPFRASSLSVSHPGVGASLDLVDKLRLLACYMATHPGRLDVAKRLQWQKVRRVCCLGRTESWRCCEAAPHCHDAAAGAKGAAKGQWVGLSRGGQVLRDATLDARCWRIATK
jgi:hypothetical protein